ncbi:MAG TPA: hypothetical protein VLE89_07405 [Chlamydiales bacterium]|nr:hypothetical protein [Chlamydiales bacterium]
MLELSPARKNKVNLNDYNCQLDIENRMLLADFSTFDVEVLEEILYSPLKISVKKISRSLECDESDLLASLKKLSQGGLLAVQDDSILVDKEKRKYFEFQIARFDPDFKPDMEFIQGLLRKVPIHLLPSWYSIPRTSNNIFESIVEKYLLSPQIFQRYLMELNLGDPKITGVVQDVFSAPDFRVSSSDLIGKYNLKRRDFEEILLFLEFNFVCCLIYEKEDDHWLEFVTPFYEWNQYLHFLKRTETPLIADPNSITRSKESDFALIEDMSALLLSAKKKPTPLPNDPYLTRLIDKLCLVRLADRIDGKLHTLEAADDWLGLTLENRSLHLYRHSLNRILNPSLSTSLNAERHIREAEKSIRRVLHGEWVFFDDFFKGVFVSLSEESVVMLKRTGKHWKYSLPTYNEEEKALVKATIFEWLFEMGMVAIGTSKEHDCFCVTPFGRFFFEE